MKDTVVRSLEEDEKRRFFEFARSLPDKDLWGRKSRFLVGDFQRFQEFFGYIKPFPFKCFLVAEEDAKFAGFVVAIYNPQWTSDLAERYGHDVDKRAYILGIAFVQRRTDVLNALTNELTAYFRTKGIKYVEYPTLGNICLTTATDVLTPENVDALITFREAGFKISECYYSMKLDLSTYKHSRNLADEKRTFRFEEQGIKIVHQDDVLGEIKWDPVENGKTSIGICVARADRGEGLGKALMAEGLHRLKTQGAKVIELGVDGNNLPALKLYRKFGFQVYSTHFYVLAPCWQCGGCT